MNQARQTPGLVNWMGYLAITLLLVLPLSVFTVRSGAWQEGLLLYAISCLGCLLLLLLAIVLMLLPRFSPWRSGIAWRACFALPGALLLLALIGSRGDYPAIHDITTDTRDPPQFSRAQELRGDAANPLDILQETISQQQEAYPQLQTLLSPMPIDRAFDHALQVAQDMGWDVYHQDRNVGIIEAVDTTAIMVFKDDVVIRLRSNARGTLVDLRSVSRVGIGDMGANARRISAFAQKFQQQED